VYRFQTCHESREKESPDSAARFWQFSVEMWRHDAMRDGLLALQDEFEANINMVLFAVWLAGERRNLEPDSVAKSGLSDWNTAMTSPLRTLRRQAKAESAELYQCLKTAELVAERHEQRLLVATLGEHAPAGENTSRESLLQANLVCYLQTLHGRDVSVALHHCETLLQQTLLYTPPKTQETDSP